MTICVPYFLKYMFTYVFLVFRVLHEHIQRLSKVVTANHRALQIPEVTQVYVARGWSCDLTALPAFQGNHIIKYVTLFALEGIQSHPEVLKDPSKDLNSPGWKGTGTWSECDVKLRVGG